MTFYTKNEDISQQQTVESKIDNTTNQGFNNAQSSNNGSSFEKTTQSFQGKPSSVSRVLLGFGTFDQNGSVGGLRSSSIDDIQVKTIQDRMVTYLESFQKEGIESFVALLDNKTNHTQLRFSSMVVGIWLKDRKEIAGLHTLVFASTGNIEDRPINNHNRFSNGTDFQSKTFYTPTDACDQKLIDKVSEVGDIHAVGVKFRISGFTVIPTFFDVSDKDALEKLIVGIVNAITVEFSREAAEFRDLDSSILTRNSVLNKIEVAYTPNAVYRNIVGSPIRSDMEANFIQSRLSNPQSGSAFTLNNGQTDNLFARVHGYTDLVPVEPIPLNQLRVGENQLWFAPNFVITGMDLPFAPTPACVMLGIFTSISLASQNNWMKCFFPKETGNGYSATDIGAITLETRQAVADNEPAKRLGTTRKGTFTDTDLVNFLGSNTRPDLNISLDYTHGTPESSWLEFIFLAEMGKIECINMIFKACDTLTNNIFGQRYDRTKPMFVNVGNVRIGGYYEDVGGKSDIRKVDRLRVLNHNEADLSVVWKYDEATLNTSLDRNVRLTVQSSITQDATANSAKVTSLIDRITFSTYFLSTFNQCMIEAGVQWQINGPMSPDLFGGNRSTASWVATSGLPAQNVGRGAMGGGNGNSIGYSIGNGSVGRSW